ncbi:MAG: L-threonylcarbamoyladenylate synthase, partial [Microgenomates group bacterium]
MQIIPATDHGAISLALAALSRGELVIYPTETCYGIAADTTNPGAVTKLLAYKGDRHRQVAIAVDSRAMAKTYVELNGIAQNLYKEFLPGPITVISQSKHVCDERLESSQGGLGIRIPNYPFTQLLIKSFSKPITATSANTSGKKEPYSLEDWKKYTTQNKQEMVSIFLDAGRLADRPTSTVVDTTLNDPQILRQGALIIPALSPSFTTSSSEETQEVAHQIISKHLSLTRRFPLILALQGDLGVGKTQFVKG